jgi:hypothetical protein
MMTYVNCPGFMIAYIGDTFYRAGAPVEPMPGFKPAKAMVDLSAKQCTWQFLIFLLLSGLRWRFPC